MRWRPIVVLVFLAAAFCLLVVPSPTEFHYPKNYTEPVVAGTMLPGKVFAVYEESVVGVSEKIYSLEPGLQSLHSGFLGTGFVVADGYVLTCFHAVSFNGYLRVSSADSKGIEQQLAVMAGGIYHDVRVVAIDAEWDLALLKVSGTESEAFRKKPLRFPPNFSSLVFSFGQPQRVFFSFRVSPDLPPLTVRHDRFLGVYVEYVQYHYATIGKWTGVLSKNVEPGFSGSPVVGEDGECVGMVYSYNPSLQKTFFIPANVILDFLRKAGIDSQQK